MFEVLLIIIFNIIIYSYTVTFDLVMDDSQWYAKLSQKGWTKTNNPLDILAERFYSGGTFGLNKKLDHFVTMTMWTLLCVMIYFAFGPNKISLVTALLVSCHPMMNQLSIWLNGRRYLVCAILLMGMIILFKTYLWPIGIILYFLSGIFQVTIVLAPVLFIMKMKYSWIMLTFIGILIYFLKDWLKSKYDSRMKMIPCEDLRQWKPQRPIVIVKLFGFYFWKMIIPGRVQMIYPFIQMYGRTKDGNINAYSINADFFKGLAGIACLGIFIFFIPSMYIPYVVFLFLSLLQWSGVIPITQTCSDRYAAIPAIFMCFFISYFSLTFLPAVYAYSLIAIFITQYVYSTVIVFKMYKNLDSWYDYHTQYDPGNLAVTNLHIGLWLGQQRVFQANALLERALAKHPNDYALNFLGYISAMIFQNFPLAMSYIDKCKKSIYLGEEKERTVEIEEAEMAIKAMTGQLNINMPQRYSNKKG